jgi:hypothetical protein
MCFLFNTTTLQGFVTYLTGALYVHTLWFYKHQPDNRVRSTQNALSLPFAAILVNCAPSGEMYNYCTPHIIKENFESSLIHRCNYILLSQVYCVWKVVEYPKIIFNNPVFMHTLPLPEGRTGKTWALPVNEELWLEKCLYMLSFKGSKTTFLTAIIIVEVELSRSLVRSVRSRN